MKKQRKTDLFRFMTLRSTELITGDRKKLGFVSPLSPEDSDFLSILTDESAYSDMVDIANSFTPFESLSALQALHDDMWKFSNWLQANKHTFLLSEVTAELPTELSSAEEMLIWDNLYYDLIKRSDRNLREACLRLLIANYYVRNCADYDPIDPMDEVQLEAQLKFLHRLANGKVLIHKIFAQPKESTPGPSFPSLPYFGQLKARQEYRHRSNLANLEISFLEQIKKELVSLQLSYEDDYQTNYASDYATYLTAANAEIAEFLSKNSDINEKRMSEDSIPESVISDFSFEYVKPLNPSYTTGKLTEAAEEYVEANSLLNYSIPEAINFVSDAIVRLKKNNSQDLRGRSAEVLINGVPFQRVPSNSMEYTINLFKHIHPVTKAVTYTVQLTLNTGTNGSYFNSVNATFKIGPATYTSSNYKLFANDNKTLFVELLVDTPFSLSTYKAYTLDVVFQLDDSKSWSLGAKGNIVNLYSSGLAIRSVDSDDEIIYGVTSLGISDYRKVEQEICCYLPGEVSHIENILAKEYKEKSTRNLTRTETTVESLTEREMEELKDETSTTRHEMSTEISEVIERDRQTNLGYSAGIHGEIFHQGYSLNTSGDFTFGQNTSDSNVMAKTYAEDVTRRALERIVQKTSVKRTTRMLQEFEENNKHGYDNRTGEVNITGVFRWIDKVYKNRVVNYGKRLLYEFMVPEPARFYKEAVIIEAEQTDSNSSTSGALGSSTVAIKPTHPSENGIKDAGSITRDNYSGLAALYGATIDAPQPAFSSVSANYAHSIGSTDSNQAFSHGDMMVPMNYECVEIQLNVNYSWKALVIPHAFITVNAAGKLWQKTGLHLTGNTSEPSTHVINNTEGAIPVAITSKKITSLSVSVVAKCALKTSLFEQWQQEAYADIMSAYQAKLDAYESAQSVASAESTSDKTSNSLDINPFFNYEIVKTELKRLCIEMLTTPFAIQQGRDFYQLGGCEVPQLKLSGDLDKYGEYVKFFEQAFDWDLMAQKFYPYYWAKRCDWKSLFQSQSNTDPVFQAFLQSGMGRIVVPVREGFEDTVMYFMETGEVWNGHSMVFNTDDNLYVSAADEMTQIGGVVEGAEWETIVPSSLTIVQEHSVVLKEGGLPCCGEVEAEGFDPLNLDTDLNILKREGEEEIPG